jgi:hypothetical protein
VILPSVLNNFPGSPALPSGITLDEATFNLWLGRYVGDHVWNEVIVNATRPNGSAGEVLENVPKVIAVNKDL